MAIKCAVCKHGGVEHAPLYRVNAFGVPGVWAHLGCAPDAKGADADTVRLVEVLDGPETPEEDSLTNPEDG